MITNPTGKGGFADHPELRSPGGWKKENTFSWQMNRFKNMTQEELVAWGKTPEKKRLVVEQMAFVRITKAMLDLEEFKVVADRSEGKAVQPTDVTSNGETIDLNSFSGVLEKIYGNKTKADTPSESST